MNASRIARRISTFAAAIAIATTGTLLSGATAASAAEWQLHELDGDYCYDMATLDLEGNGYANDVWMDLDNDCRWDTRQWNTRGHDSFHERMSFDRNEDGYLNALLIDTDQRVGFDYVKQDRDGDGYWDAPRDEFNSGYRVLTDMSLTATRLGPGQWVYNPYL